MADGTFSRKPDYRQPGLAGKNLIAYFDIETQALRKGYRIGQRTYPRFSQLGIAWMENAPGETHQANVFRKELSTSMWARDLVEYTEELRELERLGVKITPEERNKAIARLLQKNKGLNKGSWDYSVLRTGPGEKEDVLRGVFNRQADMTSRYLDRGRTGEQIELYSQKAILDQFMDTVSVAHTKGYKVGAWNLNFDYTQMHAAAARFGLQDKFAQIMGSAGIDWGRKSGKQAAGTLFEASAGFKQFLFDVMRLRAITTQDASAAQSLKAAGLDIDPLKHLDRLLPGGKTAFGSTLDPYAIPELLNKLPDFKGETEESIMRQIRSGKLSFEKLQDSLQRVAKENRGSLLEAHRGWQRFMEIKEGTDGYLSRAGVKYENLAAMSYDAMLEWTDRIDDDPTKLVEEGRFFGGRTAWQERNLSAKDTARKYANVEMTYIKGWRLKVAMETLGRERVQRVAGANLVEHEAHADALFAGEVDRVFSKWQTIYDEESQRHLADRRLKERGKKAVRAVVDLQHRQRTNANLQDEAAIIARTMKRFEHEALTDAYEQETMSSILRRWVQATHVDAADTLSSAAYNKWYRLREDAAVVNSLTANATQASASSELNKARARAGAAEQRSNLLDPAITKAMPEGTYDIPKIGSPGEVWPHISAVYKQAGVEVRETIGRIWNKPVGKIGMAGAALITALGLLPRKDWEPEYDGTSLSPVGYEGPAVSVGNVIHSQMQAMADAQGNLTELGIPVTDDRGNSYLGYIDIYTPAGPVEIKTPYRSNFVRGFDQEHIDQLRGYMRATGHGQGWLQTVNPYNPYDVTIHQVFPEQRPDIHQSETWGDSLPRRLPGLEPPVGPWKQLRGMYGDPSLTDFGSGYLFRKAQNLDDLLSGWYRTRQVDIQALNIDGRVRPKLEQVNFPVNLKRHVNKHYIIPRSKVTALPSDTSLIGMKPWRDPGAAIGQTTYRTYVPLELPLSRPPVYDIEPLALAAKRGMDPYISLGVTLGRPRKAPYVRGFTTGETVPEIAIGTVPIPKIVMDPLNRGGQTSRQMVSRRRFKNPGEQRADVRLLPDFWADAGLSPSVLSKLHTTLPFDVDDVALKLVENLGDSEKYIAEFERMRDKVRSAYSWDKLPKEVRSELLRQGLKQEVVQETLQSNVNRAFEVISPSIMGVEARAPEEIVEALLGRADLPNVAVSSAVPNGTAGELSALSKRAMRSIAHNIQRTVGRAIDRKFATSGERSINLLTRTNVVSAAEGQLVRQSLMDQGMSAKRSLDIVRELVEEAPDFRTRDIGRWLEVEEKAIARSGLFAGVMTDSASMINAESRAAAAAIGKTVSRTPKGILAKLINLMSWDLLEGTHGRKFYAANAVKKGFDDSAKKLGIKPRPVGEFMVKPNAGIGKWLFEAGDKMVKRGGETRTAMGTAFKKISMSNLKWSTSIMYGGVGTGLHYLTTGNVGEAMAIGAASTFGSRYMGGVTGAMALSEVVYSFMLARENYTNLAGGMVLEGTRGAAAIAAGSIARAAVAKRVSGAVAGKLAGRAAGIAVKASPLKIPGVDLIAQFVVQAVTSVVIGTITDAVGEVLGIRKKNSVPEGGFVSHNTYADQLRSGGYISGARDIRSPHVMIDGVAVSGQNLSDFGSGYRVPSQLQNTQPEMRTRQKLSIRSMKTAGLPIHLHETATARRRAGSGNCNAPMASSASMCA